MSDLLIRLAALAAIFAIGIAIALILSERWGARWTETVRTLVLAVLFAAFAGAAWPLGSGISQDRRDRADAIATLCAEIASPSPRAAAICAGRAGAPR